MKNIYYLTTAITLLFATSTLAQNLYFEDFEQGEAALDVWINAWSQGPNSIRVESGGLLVTGSRADVITGDPQVADMAKTSVRARASLDGTSSGGIGLMTNADAAERIAYQAGIDPDDSELYLGWNGPGEPGFKAFQIVETDIDLFSGDEVFLQFDVFEREGSGYDMALWVWPVGEPMPAEPQLTYVDTSVVLAPGEPAFLFDNLAAPGTSTIRLDDFQVSNISIPEPTSNMSGLLAAITILLFIRQRTISSRASFMTD